MSMSKSAGTVHQDVIDGFDSQGIGEIGADICTATGSTGKS